MYLRATGNQCDPVERIRLPRVTSDGPKEEQRVSRGERMDVGARFAFRILFDGEVEETRLG